MALVPAKEEEPSGGDGQAHREVMDKEFRVARRTRAVIVLAHVEKCGACGHEVLVEADEMYVVLACGRKAEGAADDHHVLVGDDLPDDNLRERGEPALVKEANLRALLGAELVVEARGPLCGLVVNGTADALDEAAMLVVLGYGVGGPGNVDDGGDRHEGALVCPVLPKGEKATGHRALRSGLVKDHAHVM